MENTTRRRRLSTAPAHVKHLGAGPPGAVAFYQGMGNCVPRHRTLHQRILSAGASVMSPYRCLYAVLCRYDAATTGGRRRATRSRSLYTFEFRPEGIRRRACLSGNVPSFDSIGGSPRLHRSLLVIHQEARAASKQQRRHCGLKSPESQITQGSNGILLDVIDTSRRKTRREMLATCTRRPSPSSAPDRPPGKGRPIGRAASEVERRGHARPSHTHCPTLPYSRT